MNEIKKITDMIKKFRDERDWKQFHDPRNMAISIVLEASELLEHFQWKSKEEIEQYVKNKKNRGEIQDEIADIAAYLFELADNMDIDLMAAVKRKLAKNRKKYPVKKAKGKHTKYTKL
ncbi:MAG: nucleotide pyrophosphohydrolase [Phycisphaerales bacterium]